MDANEVDERYLYINKRWGSIVGVWPYGNDRQKWIGRIITILMAVSFIATQIARIAHYLSVDTMIEQCPFLVVGIGIIIKEVNYIIHEKQLRMLLGHIHDDWSTIRSRNEMDIMEKFAKRGLFLSHLYVVNGWICYVIFCVTAFVPRILDIISPKNESRGLAFICPADYIFLDEEKHYFIIMAHMISAMTTVLLVFVSCDTIYMNIVQHACGLLNVTGHRFMRAIEDEVSSQKQGTAWKTDQTYKNICHSIEAHQHAIKYIVDIENVHDTYLFIVVALVVLSFSITLVKTSTMEPSADFFKYCSFLVIQIVHLFVLSVQGHFVILSSDSIYDNIYDGLWYNTTPQAQCLYVLALRMNLTPRVLTAGGLITLNLECFAGIIKTSFSYFTVLRSR